MSDRPFHQVLRATESVTASRTTVLDDVNWLRYNQVSFGIKVTDVTTTGAGDTFDFKLQYERVKDDWVDLLSATQLTAAGSETKTAIRTAAVTWSGRIRAVETVGAGATAAGCQIEVWGNEA